jgi:RNA polymerase sigma factor (sigma-70 family)
MFMSGGRIVAMLPAEAPVTKVAAMKEKSEDGYELVRGVLRGRPEDIEVFKTRSKQWIWATCLQLTAGQTHRETQKSAEAAFKEIWEAMAAGGFASLRSYAGETKTPPNLKTFVVAKVREIMTSRVLRLLRERPPQGWPFEALFQSMIDHAVKQKFSSKEFPNEEEVSAVHEDVMLHLGANGYERVLDYKEEKPLAAYVSTIVRNRLKDILDYKYGRLRMPAAVGELPFLDQLIWNAIWKFRISADASTLITEMGKREALGLTKDEVAAQVKGADKDQFAFALKRVVKIVGLAPLSNRPIVVDIESEGAKKTLTAVASPAARPDEAFEEKQIVERVQAALATLPSTDALYLKLLFMRGVPAREIAHTMGRPVKEIYPLRKTAVAKMRGLLADLNDEDQDNVRQKTTKGPHSRPISRRAGQTRSRFDGDKEQDS